MSPPRGHHYSQVHIDGHPARFFIVQVILCASCLASVAVLSIGRYS